MAATATKTKATETAPTAAEDATAPVAQETKELTPAELALQAKSGTQVIAPIGNMTVIVQHRFRNGGALLTEDGEGRYEGECKHERKLVDEGPAPTRVYYEFVGGENDGMRGYLHRVRGCHRTYEPLGAND